MSGSQVWAFAWKAAVSAGLLAAIVFAIGGMQEVWSALASVDPRVLAAVFAVYTLDRVLMAWKWLRLLRVRGHPLPLLFGVQVYCSSQLLGMFLPATVGADALRAAASARRGVPLGLVVASIAIERILGFVAMLVMGMLGLLLVSRSVALPPGLGVVWWAAAAALGVAVTLLVASFSERIFSWLHDRVLASFRGSRIVSHLRSLHETYRSYDAHRAELLVFSVASLVEQFAPALAFWLLAQAAGLDVGLAHLVGAVSLSFLVTRIPISLGGIGVFEGAFVLLLGLAELSTAGALALALSARVVEIVSWLPWWIGFVYGGSADTERGKVG